MEKEQYCVATLQNTIVFEGTRSECLDYIYQAIQKGQKVGYLRTTTIAELEAETLKEAEGASPFPTNEKKPCPVDRGKLLIGLECCRETCADANCDRCPYYKTNGSCIDTLEGDALAYIGWMEAMVEELLSGPVQAAIKGIVSVFDEMLLEGGDAIEAACGMPRNGKADGLDPGSVLVDELENGSGFASSGRRGGHLPQKGKALEEGGAGDD